MARRALALAAIALFTIGALGFFTYADDWRHQGEVAAAFGFILAGASLFASTFHSMRQLRWLAVAVLAGLLVGVALDATAAGLVVGFAVGALVAWWRHVASSPQRAG